jgi:hypothetical protein
MLSSFCCSMTCLKWLRLLNVPLKKIMRCFCYMEAFYCGFLLDALFGLTWRMLTPCLTQTSHYKPLWSFGFWLVISLYASVNDVLSLCMIIAVIALLVGRAQSFASLHFVLSMSSTRTSNSKKSKFSNVSTIHTYCNDPPFAKGRSHVYMCHSLDQ